ncbi:MAG: YHS domain-containing protein [Candidatus Omnitrophica bacterium]|nr:YHS domain-containing protein [Candidatus Omnitrophota bacterium]
MARKTFMILVAGLIVFWISESSFAMMGMCGSGSGAKGHGGHVEAAETGSSAQTAVEEVGNKICPVSGEEITEEGKATYEYKGKTYNFCCPMCIDEFKKDPEKYIEKIKEQESKEGHEQHH